MKSLFCMLQDIAEVSRPPCIRISCLNVPCSSSTHSVLAPQKQSLSRIALLRNLPTPIDCIAAMGGASDSGAFGVAGGNTAPILCSSANVFSTCQKHTHVCHGRVQHITSIRTGHLAWSTVRKRPRPSINCSRPPLPFAGPNWSSTATRSTLLGFDGSL